MEACMARKNVVSISTNVTPEQKDAIEQAMSQMGVTEAEFVRNAIARYVILVVGEWPKSIIRHGGRTKDERIVKPSDTT